MTFIVGSSGPGKSTIAALLINVEWLRDGLGVVSQQTQLFENASVEENILYGTPKEMFPSDEHREEIIRRAALLAKTDWLDTKSGFKAALREVLGGQAQRVQIVRALAREHTHLLILDECTSALEVENRDKLFRLLPTYTERNEERD